MSGLAKAKVVDIHAHVVLSSSMNAAGRAGPEIGYSAQGEPWFRVGDYTFRGVRYENTPFMDASLRLNAMAESGIDFQVLSPNPLSYLYDIDARSASKFAAKHNEALAQHVAFSPDHLGGFATLPMQDVDAACAELERSTQEFGLLGACIGTNFGYSMSSSEFDTLLAACADLNVPLMIHPSPPSREVFESEPNLTHYDLEILVGFAGYETISVAHLVFSGVLAKYPELRVCISHGGGALSSLYGRLSLASRKRKWASVWAQDPLYFKTELQRLWFDCNTHDTASLARLMSIADDTKIVFGTNFAGWDQNTDYITESQILHFSAASKRFLGG